MRRLLPLLLLSATPALADAETDRLLTELDQLAEKGAWPGVERVYGDLVDREIEIPAAAHVLGSRAAAQRGDASTAYRRALRAERTEAGSTDGAFAGYRTGWARLEVLRLDDSCITLTPEERPFDPLKAAAVDYAAATLAEEGGFRGLLPAGTYTLGGATVLVAPDAPPAIIQRTDGDSDCR